MAETQPIQGIPPAPALTLAPSWTDPQTGAVYVHKDLLTSTAPWEVERHIGPMKSVQEFGDVPSFVAYVQRYGGVGTLATWNSGGFLAALDHAGGPDAPGRGTWVAVLPFTKSHQWEAWRAVCNAAMTQKTAVEKLEDLAEDIVEPAAGEFLNLLRTLRASVNAKAETELRPDGSTSVVFAQESRIKSGAVELPASFAISIPVLKGHLDDQGRPVLYRLQVRLRASVDDAAHLSLRLSMPNADRVLEAVYADRVAVATVLLGDQFPLLRAAD